MKDWHDKYRKLAAEIRRQRSLLPSGPVSLVRGSPELSAGAGTLRVHTAVVCGLARGQSTQVAGGRRGRQQRGQFHQRRQRL